MARNRHSLFQKTQPQRDGDYYYLDLESKSRSMKLAGNLYPLVLKWHLCFQIWWTGFKGKKKKLLTQAHKTFAVFAVSKIPQRNNDVIARIAQSCLFSSSAFSPCYVSARPACRNKQTLALRTTFFFCLFKTDYSRVSATCNLGLLKISLKIMYLGLIFFSLVLELRDKMLHSRDDCRHSGVQSQICWGSRPNYNLGGSSWSNYFKFRSYATHPQTLMQGQTRFPKKL